MGYIIVPRCIPVPLWFGVSLDGRSKIMRQAPAEQSEKFQQFWKGTSQLLGCEIRDPQARRFRHLFKRALRKNPKLAGQLKMLADLREELVDDIKYGRQRLPS